MKKTPLEQTKEVFGSKDKLVDEIVSLVKRPSDIPKEQFKKKLSAQSNKKLMTLLKREKLIKEKFGNRDKLIDAIVQARTGKNKSGDKDYRSRLDGMTSGQLLDLAKRVNLTAGK